MKESIIQQQIAEYLSARGYFFFSIPNEHYNISHAQRMTLKKMGLIPGIPDLCIIYKARAYFLEVKNEAGELSPNQIMIHKILMEKQIPVSIVRSVENVETALRLWGIG